MARFSQSRIRQLQKKYPIDDRLPDWFFRVTEVSAGVFLVEGTDTSGRTVSYRGTDADQLLERCILDARSDTLVDNHWQRADAWVIVPIIRATPKPPVTLPHILAWSEAINCACPTVDELNGAFNRLVAAGLITARENDYALTVKGHGLRERFQDSCSGDVSELYTCLLQLLQFPEYAVQMESADAIRYVTDADFESATEEMGKYLGYDRLP